MNYRHAMDTFHRMGWGIEFHEQPTRDTWAGKRIRGESRLDVKGPIGKQFFEVKLGEDMELVVLDSNKKEAAILVMLKDHQARHGYQNVSKLLLGHDDRQLYVAAVPLSTRDVSNAKDRLKPRRVVEAEREAGVKTKDKNRHKTKAWKRQGDFFFVPAPEFDVESSWKNKIHLHEPINQRGGRAHIVEELYRIGGESGYANGNRWISVDAYHDLPAAEKKTWRWAPRNPRAYARGRVTHPEHPTCILNGWHEICPNTEAAARDISGRPVWRNMAFVD